MRVRNYILSLVVVLLVTSLTFEKETYFRVEPVKYTQWFTSHKGDFIRTVTIGKFTYEIMLIPMEIKLLNYAKSNKLSKKEVEDFISEHEKSYEFSLRIQIPENGTKEFLKYEGGNGKSYDEKLKYYSFDLKNTIKLFSKNGQQSQCEEYIFERNFDIQPSATISFSMQKPEKNTDFTIEINDTGFIENKVLFAFESQKINNRPKLKYSKIWKTR
ncbi:MAG: hypothetical protein HYR91_15450 [Flavobacteriia bacterium]|nr:hypothetical protein [Flavobacteriia bacterium]